MIGTCPVSLGLQTAVKGHNMNESTLPGSPALQDGELHSAKPTVEGGAMKGQILAFSVQSNSGTISGLDGKRYQFVGSEWKDTGVPTRGMTVDFDVEDSLAKAVYLAIGSATTGSKNKLAAGLLAIFLGGLGIHKFYLGFTGPGLIFLLINTIGFAVTWMFFWIPNMILGVISLIEGIIYLTKSDEEFEQLYVVQKKKWF
jgi:TM2 domain-containing membrane protein YozV